MGYRIIVFMTLIIIIVYYLKQNRDSFKIDDIKGIDTFDKYFYINLEHRKDRNKQILNEFKKINLDKNKIIRIDAIRNKYNGHIGCAKSHVKSLKLAKKMNLKNVIIFEDDFIFTLSKEDIDKKINMFLNHFKNDWDVIQLTTYYKKLDNLNNKEIDKHVKKVIYATTSSAYIIQDHFYDKLIENLSSSINKMENEMKEWSKNNKGIKKRITKFSLDAQWNTLQKKSKWYIFSPYLGKQGGDAEKSSIVGGIEDFTNFK
jgi:glycosyl transferase family 25